MGTRYHDQPPEHWSGPGSLDPTPVWKQLLLIGLLLLGALAVIGVFGYLSLATELAAPPALVPGDRLVLARSALPPAGAPPVRIGPPLLNDARAFWLVQPAAGDVVAVRARWSPADGARDCEVVAFAPGGSAALATDRRAPVFQACPTAEGFLLGARGEPYGAPRALDRYLVSVSDDRVVVNLSRTIRGVARTEAPSPSSSPRR